MTDTTQHVIAGVAIYRGEGQNSNTSKHRTIHWHLISQTAGKKVINGAKKMTDLEKIGAHYDSFLGELLDGLDNDMARAVFMKMTLNAVLTQFVRRKGFAEVAGLLRHVADHLDAQNRRAAN
ncbi:MAG: hypothetical protein HY273_14705 [Gammaproteobacteria bacterium]|nr:hypothetical protein [Gammaproteobacteria bacterium]